MAAQGSLEARLWNRVDRRGPDECWEWQGGCTALGYGAITLPGGRGGRTHRVAWMLAHGPIPTGAWVLHHCDNRRCCNPAHLYLGGIRENNRDRDERNRLCHGDKHPSAKLTAALVLDLRRRWAAGGLTWGQLAREHGVTPRAIKLAITGKTWKRA